MLTKEKYLQFVEILKEELVPAMGCTEPISIAYAVAKARATLGEKPVCGKLEVSGNIVKNGEVVAQRRGRSVHPTRQTEPHTHFVDKTPDGYLAVCDLGTDTLAFYDKDLRLASESKVPSGYGIRHLVFSKDGKYIYAVNELVPSISIFSYEDGKASLIDTLTIECENKKANGAAVRLSENGRYLYVSLREENVICVFVVNGEKLTHIQTVGCGGDSPRDFELCRNYLLCTNEKSGNIIVFDLCDGKLGAILQEIPCGNVLCVVK